MYGLIKVRDDLYDIARRIKEVDDRYELYYNARLDRYEIHADGALQIAVPFKRPDARTVETLVLRQSKRMKKGTNWRPLSRRPYES